MPSCATRYDNLLAYRCHHGAAISYCISGEPGCQTRILPDEAQIAFQESALNVRCLFDHTVVALDTLLAAVDQDDVVQTASSFEYVVRPPWLRLCSLRVTSANATCRVWSGQRDSLSTSGVPSSPQRLRLCSLHPTSVVTTSYVWARCHRRTLSIPCEPVILGTCPATSVAPPACDVSHLWHQLHLVVAWPRPVCAAQTFIEPRCAFPELHCLGGTDVIVDLNNT